MLGGPLEEQVLQVTGKVAGIGGLALGIFLLLFREVIRKNIFPTLSDEEAYKLIRQFMYLTFCLALFGLASWTYISVAPMTARAQLHRLKHPVSDISGTWTAVVKYPWGDTYHETFTFQANGSDIEGMATYVMGPNGIVEGKMDGDHVSFRTVSYTELGDQHYQEKHHYTGTVSGDTIDCVLQTDSGYNSTPLIKFTAHKVAGK